MLNKARYDAEEKLIVRKFAKVVKVWPICTHECR